MFSSLINAFMSIEKIIKLLIYKIKSFSGFTSNWNFALYFRSLCAEKILLVMKVKTLQKLLSLKNAWIRVIYQTILKNQFWVISHSTRSFFYLFWIRITMVTHKFHNLFFSNKVCVVTKSLERLDAQDRHHLASWYSAQKIIQKKVLF